MRRLIGYVGVLIGALLVAALTLAYAVSLQRASLRPNSDFGIFYYGLEARLNGGSFYQVTAAGQSWGAPFVDNLIDLAPPHLHLLIWPLRPLGFTSAYWAWITLNVTALIGSLCIITRELHVPWREAWVLGSLIAAGTAYMITIATLTGGQYAWLLLLPCTLAWRGLRRGRWVVAFAWLGVVLSFKPYPIALLAYALWHRQWRAALVMPMVATACAVPGVIAFGLESYFLWPRALMYGGTQQAWMFGNLSLFGVAARAFGESPAMIPLAHFPRTASVVATLLAAATALAAVLRVRTADPDSAWLLLWLTAFLCVPLSWAYYLWWLLPALIAKLRGAPSTTVGGLTIALAAFVVPPLGPNFWGVPALTSITASLPMVATAATWCWIATRPMTSPK